MACSRISCPKPKSSRRRPKRRKCLRPGPITRNPYLNFLRDFRKKNCGLSCIQVAVRGAKCWRCLNSSEKCKYIKMARCAPKRKRRRRHR